MTKQIVTLSKSDTAALIKHSMVSRETRCDLVHQELNKLQKEGLFNVKSFIKTFGKDTYDRFVRREAKRRARLIRQAPEAVILNPKRRAKFLEIPKALRQVH